MQPTTEQKSAAFPDRRQAPTTPRDGGAERRQFGNSHANLRPEVAELADAVDRYKLMHRRRFITFDELYDVIAGLGYKKPAANG